MKRFIIMMLLSLVFVSNTIQAQDPIDKPVQNQITKKDIVKLTAASAGVLFFGIAALTTSRIVQKRASGSPIYLPLVLLSAPIYLLYFDKKENPAEPFTLQEKARIEKCNKWYFGIVGAFSGMVAIGLGKYIYSKIRALKSQGTKYH